jgi:hypothetical protein
MSEAIFHLGLLRNYQVVSNPGVYVVTVAYTVTGDSLILDGHPRYIIPLRVVDSKSLVDLVKLVKDETKIMPFVAVRSYFISGVLWANTVDIEELPVKGERVLAAFDEKNGKLRCTNIELLPREELDYVNVDHVLEFRKTLFNLMNTNT